MSASNFDFLRPNAPQLCTLGRQAERYFHDDPNTSLLKLRQFGEVFAHQLAEQLGLQPRPDDSQFERIGLLQRSQRVPYDISDLLHKVRMVGNDANHAHGGDHRSALATLKLCWQLALWWHRTHIHAEHRPAPFMPPTAASATAVPDAAVQQELNRLRERVRSHQQGEASARAALLSTRQDSDSRLRAKADALAQAQLENQRLLKALTQAKPRPAAVPHAPQPATQRPARETPTPETPPCTVPHAAASGSLDAPQVELDEFEARTLIDVQLREAGWLADSSQRTHALGVRPQAGVQQAIANWPLTTPDGAAAGVADYVLFMGFTPVALVEAQALETDLAACLPLAEAKAARLRAQWRETTVQDPSHHPSPAAAHAPLRLVYAANGRPWASWLPSKSGIWFRDARASHHLPHDLAQFHRPQELQAMGVLDAPTPAHALADLHLPAWRVLNLPAHQHQALQAAETALTAGQRRVLLALAPGTGKHRTAAALVLHLLAAQRIQRVLWLDHEPLSPKPAAATPDHITSAAALCTALQLPPEAAALLPATPWELTFTSTARMARTLAHDESGRWGVGRFDLLVALDSLPPGLHASHAASPQADLQTLLGHVSQVVGHFDCPAVGLAAAATAHMAHLFGPAVFDYDTAQAVVDGIRRDHTPPLGLHTNLSVAGIWVPAGTSLPMLNRQGHAIAPHTLTHALEAEVEDFNLHAIVPAHTRAVCEALAHAIDPSHPDKTLICCVDAAHADRITHALRQAFAQRQPQLPHSAVAHLDPSVPQADALWAAFTSHPFPNVAVSAHALSLLPAVPAVRTLVMLRREDSPLWLDQWLSRAAHPGTGVADAPFRVIDGTRQFEPVMRWHDSTHPTSTPSPTTAVQHQACAGPVPAAGPAPSAASAPARPPKTKRKSGRGKSKALAQAPAMPMKAATPASHPPAAPRLTALVAELLRVDTHAARAHLLTHMQQALQGLATHAQPVTRAVVRSAAGVPIGALAQHLASLGTAELAPWWQDRPGLAELLDAARESPPPDASLPICPDPDQGIELSPHWGDMAAAGSWRATRAVDSPSALFAGLRTWLRHWREAHAPTHGAPPDMPACAIRAVHALCDHPSRLQWADMRALAVAMQRAGFGEARLAHAWQAVHGQCLWPRHAGWVRHALLGEPPVPHPLRIAQASQRLQQQLPLLQSPTLSPDAVQAALQALAQQTQQLLVPDWPQWAQARAHETPAMARARLDALFGGHAQACVTAMAELLWMPAA